jgi:hypothetical protein
MFANNVKSVAFFHTFHASPLYIASWRMQGGIPVVCCHNVNNTCDSRVPPDDPLKDVVTLKVR